MARNMMRVGVICLGLGASASGASAATIAYEGASAPTGLAVIAANATLSASALNSNNDYTDNAGPPGELFTPATSDTLRSITIHGGTGGTPSGMRLLVGSVNTSTQAVTPLNGTGTGLTGGESATSPSAMTDYVTYALATPIGLTAGTEYVFAFATSASWYGLSHGTGSTAGAVNMNDSNTFENNNTGRPSKNNGFGQYAAINTGNYQYYFIASSTVPEPGSLGVLCAGAAGLLIRRKRRC